MNRRKLKKRIPALVKTLVAPVQKLLAANARVHPDIIAGYENQIERGVFNLMQVHLILDPAWPHRERWLDGLSEDFTWEKRGKIIFGRGDLYWGHWPEVSRKTTGLKFASALQLCHRHGVDYVFRYGDPGNVRTYHGRCTATDMELGLMRTGS